VIAVVDYGLGNIQAFLNIYARLNVSAVAASSPGQLETANKIILPGVGAFDWAMSRLEASGLRSKLDDLVLNHSVPILGVCVGMQMMAQQSAEGELAGLGWIDADVKKIESVGAEDHCRLPHMGWNDVKPETGNELFKDMPDFRFYFLHSYYVVPRNSGDVLATTDYGSRFCCSIRAGNILGTQFHPEKSHHWGIKLLKNFAEL